MAVPSSTDRIEARMHRLERKLDALRRGRTIEAIRNDRRATGAGLREAKQVIDSARI